MYSVLAVKLSDPVDFGMGAVDNGYRAVLSLRHIVGKVQSTIFYGDSLHLLGHDASQLDPEHAFRFFVNQFKNKKVTWANLDQIPPNPLMMTRRIYLIPTPPPNPPVEEGLMQVMDCGYDPAKGFWIQFLGNFWLHIPIFRNFPSVERVFD